MEEMQVLLTRDSKLCLHTISDILLESKLWVSPDFFSMLLKHKVGARKHFLKTTSA